MIGLRRIDSNTYPLFFNRIVRLYAEESLKAGRWTEEEAFQRSKEETAKLLPENEETKDNFMYWIMNDELKVGYIWAGVTDQNKKEAFIFGIEIDGNERNKGYGQEAMSHIEAILRDMDFSSVRLHVFEQSEMALHIYNKTGYRTISRLMRKKLK